MVERDDAARKVDKTEQFCGQPNVQVRSISLLHLLEIGQGRVSDIEPRPKLFPASAFTLLRTLKRVFGLERHRVVLDAMCGCQQGSKFVWFEGAMGYRHEKESKDGHLVSVAKEELDHPAMKGFNVRNRALIVDRSHGINEGLQRGKIPYPLENPDYEFDPQIRALLTACQYLGNPLEISIGKPKPSVQEMSFDHLKLTSGKVVYPKPMLRLRSHV